MSTDDVNRKNDPREPEESNDIKAIRREREWNILLRELWQHGSSGNESFHRELERVAIAAQDWPNATYSQRFRALRILVTRFGRNDTSLLCSMVSSKSQQPWKLSIRRRKDSEKPDRGKRDRRNNRIFLAERVGREVYLRMLAGQSKEEAIYGVKDDYRTGAPYPKIENWPFIHRPKIDLPDFDGIEKLLNIFRQRARNRGDVDVFAPFFPAAHEPELILSEIPSRGRPRKK